MIVKKVYKGTTPFIKGYKGNILLFEEGGLPSQYQQIEYIQSTSNNKNDNYIDTGYVPQVGMVFRIQCMFDGTYPLTDYGRLFGANNSYYRLEGMNSYSNMSFYWETVGTTVRFSANTLYEVEVSDGLYVDGNQIASATFQYNYPNSKNLWLFSSDGGDRDGAYKLYSCVITENGEEVRNFVPCYIKATSEVGLYDLVTQQFYPNLGSVPFVAGGDV